MLESQSYHAVLAVQASCARTCALAERAARGLDGCAAAWASGAGQSRPDIQVTPMATLYVQDGSGFREAAAPEVFSRTRSLIAQRFRTGSQVLGHPSVVQEFLYLRLGGLEYEVFGLLHLDNRHRLIQMEELFRGTLAGASVHPREVMKSALAHNSAAVILFHNHPSGILEPSSADEFITLRLRDALALIDIRVLDHLIVGDGTFSFAQHGLL